MPDRRDESPFGGAFGPLEDLVGLLFAGLEQGFVDDDRREDRRDDPRDERPAQAERAAPRPARPRARTPRLDRHGRDLTDAARDGRLDPVIGRDEEIDQVLEVLARRTKNNPVLVGDPGVGKTAIVEGIAQRIVEGRVPETLRDVRVVSLDLAGMVAGTKYRGEFEQRLTAVIDEVVAARRSVVLFVDELHAVVGAGAAEGGPLDAGAMLKPALARGELQLVGATTVAEYRRHIERDAALERRFEPVRVDEPTVEQTVAILRGLRPRYEAHHGITITDAALEAAAALSHRHLRDRFLPDKAIDLVDRAGSRLRLRTVSGPPAEEALDERLEGLARARDVAVDAEDYERAHELTRELERVRAERESARRTRTLPELTADAVAEAIARATGIPLARLTAEDRERLLHLEDHLRRRVVGQDGAVEAVADAVRQGRSGLAHPDRPVGSFLFLGPTGVGKTELARALSEVLSDAEPARFDMSEYADASSLTRLVGAPPGYVGHNEPGQLTEAVRRNPYGVLLFDEIEKAHRDVTAALLQVLDAGRLTDAAGRTADFTHAVVIMTSNLGAEMILGATAAARPVAEVREPLVALARVHLRPEFINRVDDIVLFSALTPADLRDITGMLLAETRSRLAAQEVALEVTDAAVAWLASRGHEPAHGARPLRRTIHRELDRRLSRMLLAGDVGPGGRVRVDVAGPDAASLDLTAC
ncbi:ATP-dependent Clp protease ATP-binding subunit [Pseudonocardia sp.]|uniref:ATP-dependent Clp protease ATP-binding subunit n=1 Tax=Pseudonocardia sp. TaxID=60912 RepID=UPI003D0A512D